MIVSTTGILPGRGAGAVVFRTLERRLTKGRAKSGPGDDFARGSGEPHAAFPSDPPINAPRTGGASLSMSQVAGENYLRALRLSELDQARRFLPGTGTVLEIGAGPGWQARALAAGGVRVVAIDVAASRYPPVWPVLRYDGRRLPFRDGCFDAVFSSNVLEHVRDLPALLAETARVLKPGGRCVHVLPTPAWRLWTTATHYPRMVRLLFQTLFARSSAEQAALQWRTSPGARPELIRQALWPHRHGETGSALSEVALFSRRRWQGLFQSAGFRVEASVPGGLFYTGNALLGSRLGVPPRRRLSEWLGSAGCIYLLSRST